MSDNIFTGTIPALMTPCTAERTPDFDALVRKGRELVDLGMSAVVYCGSMGDWPLLTEAQRQEGVARLVAAGVPTVVGTGAVNSKEAVSHAAHAEKVGAGGLMVIPRVLSRGASPAARTTTPLTMRLHASWPNHTPMRAMRAAPPATPSPSATRSLPISAPSVENAIAGGSPSKRRWVNRCIR